MEQIIQKNNLPPIPNCKIYGADLKTNPEQDAITKCLNNESLSPNEENILKEAINFYKIVFPSLKAINLSKISYEEVEELKKYLNSVFNFNIMVFNDVHFEVVFRISIVKESFREKGKVRHPKYLRYPDLKIVKESKLYNRANTSDATVFYASFYENVALKETKPKKGDKIILSIWKNITGKPFNSYPITNSSINNDGIKKANNAFQKMKDSSHPLFAEIMDLNLAFLASEFVKSLPVVNPNRTEYLYSAYFSDKLLSPLREDDPVPNYDFIIYPSVAWNHQHENIAMTTNALDTKMKLVQATEYVV